MEEAKNASSRAKDTSAHQSQRNVVKMTSKGSEKPLDKLIQSRTRSGDKSIRMVTPDQDEVMEEKGSRRVRPATTYEVTSSTSPRSIPGGEKPKERRQGLVFDETFDASDSSPPAQSILSSLASGRRSSNHGNMRPRTRTLDEPRRQRGAPPVSANRHRIGSNYSTSSFGPSEDAEHEKRLEMPASLGSILNPTPKASPSHNSGSVKEKPPVSRRLVKRSNPSSRSGSPVPIPAAVDTLPVPLPADDASKVLRLMNSLEGRMKGDVEYQTTGHGSWMSGICYIDERGSFMSEGIDRGPFHQTVVPDLKGCRVMPGLSEEKESKILEVTTSPGLKLKILPLDPAHFDYWLAALLLWQQTHNSTSQGNPSPSEQSEPRTSRRPSIMQMNNANIIKVGKVLLWDKGVSQTSQLPTTPLSRRAASKEVKPPISSWRKVSCILQDNGEFKLMTENDVVVLSLIQLSQLSRSAVQQLDRTVLNEEYCIAIFPQYTPSSTSISIIKPVYISLESRVLFEVWFVLLRAFAVPEIYGTGLSEPPSEDFEQDEDVSTTPNDLFRIEKSLSIRVIEAKIRSTTQRDTLVASKNSVKSDLDTSLGDYFAEVVLNGEVRARTTTKTATIKPFWREDCEFFDLPASLPEVNILLKRMGAKEPVLQSSRSAANNHNSDLGIETLCGTVQIRLDQLDRGVDVEKWWPILDEKKVAIGEMFLKVRHDELVVLFSKDYKPIADLLHNFNSGLTIQMSHVMSGQLRYLAEILLNVFQVSGQSGPWLIALVEDEIDGIGKETPVTRLRFSRRLGSNDSFDSVSEREMSVRDMGKSLTGEANLLFRGNSLLTQALDFHMRRVGKEYLEDVLLDKIREINALNPDCEVDPSRLNHGDDLQKNWAQLNALTSSVWEDIADSSSRCPAELRQILKYIRAVAEDRYGDFLRTVPYTSVSGFLFLRFFCPALLNPKLFGLLRDHPNPKAQRTLTLIAKSLQVLANLSTFGQKEAWMEPMNRFLATNRQAVKDFIDDVCSIPAERGLQTPLASYSTPLTILRRLPHTSREGFPSLPYLVDDARTFAQLVKFWLDSTTREDNHHRASDLSGDLLTFHNHCLSLDARTSECLRKAEAKAVDKAVDGPPELTWEDIVRSLQNSRAVPAETFSEEDLVPPASTYPHAPLPVRDGHSTSAAVPGSSGSEMGKEERKQRQSFWETFGKESKASRVHAADIFANQDKWDKHDRDDKDKDKPSSRDGKDWRDRDRDTRDGRETKDGRDVREKGSKGFLSGLRKKSERDRKEEKKEKDRVERERYFQDAWEREKSSGTAAISHGAGLGEKERERDKERKGNESA
jgi:hypothetical protein